MNLTIKTLTGDELQHHLPDVASLRIRVFADFPYLYDGTMDDEEIYLAKFAAIEGAIIVACHDGEKIVGAATGGPLIGQMTEFSDPLKHAGFDCSEIFYCGESVLLPDYRGHGVGHRFFDERENQARRLMLKRSCFLSVIRLHDHPARPGDYSPLDAFWRKRGYAPLDGLTATFPWKEHSTDEEVDNQLQYWMRDL